MDNTVDNKGNPICPACRAPILADEPIAPYNELVLHGWCWWTLQQSGGRAA